MPYFIFHTVFEKQTRQCRGAYSAPHRLDYGLGRGKPAHTPVCVVALLIPVGKLQTKRQAAIERRPAFSFWLWMARWLMLLSHLNRRNLPLTIPPDEVHGVAELRG